jgi:hypothetical protein
VDEKCNTLIQFPHLLRNRNRWEERVYTDMEMWRDIHRRVIVNSESKHQVGVAFPIKDQIGFRNYFAV